MHKPFVAIAALLGGTGVALGAFGAHGLQKATSDEKIIHGFQTGVQYQICHALALLALVIIIEKMPGKLVTWSARFFIAGIIFFSGSLYLLTFLKIQNSDAVSIVGPVTPIGGLFFITGWILLLLAALKKN
jgi:uncharacterized membrane protein YgdD (TMEM256/DUF423 family)